jgi:hypothetical protein
LWCILEKKNAINAIIIFGTSLNMVFKIADSPLPFEIWQATVRRMIFSIKVFVTLLDYLIIPQVTILGDLHV